jgi:hypothetical protein
MGALQDEGVGLSAISQLWYEHNKQAVGVAEGATDVYSAVEAQAPAAEIGRPRAQWASDLYRAMEEPLRLVAESEEREEKQEIAPARLELGDEFTVFWREDLRGHTHVKVEPRIDIEGKLLVIVETTDRRRRVLQSLEREYKGPDPIEFETSPQKPDIGRRICLVLRPRSESA